MGRGIKIGNIDDVGDVGSPAPVARPRLPGGQVISRGRGIGRAVGQRIQNLSSTALDRGEAQAKAAIEEFLPAPESLAPELNPAEQEQVLEGLSIVMGALRHARGRDAHQARKAVQGLYQAVAGMGDSLGMGHVGHVGRSGSGGYGQFEDPDEDVGSEGIVDIIGLDGAGGFVRPSNDDEWR